MPADKPQPESLDFASSELLHEQLARILARQILSGQLPPGTLVTERGLAREYDIARSTVHNCLHILGAKGLVRRVPHKGTVVADVHAAKAPFSTVPVVLVREGQTNRVNPAVEPWYFHIYAGIQAMADELGYRVKKDVLRMYVQVPLKDYVPPRPSEASGVLLYGTYDERYIGMFRSEGIPLVAVDYWTQDLVTDCVAVDVEAEAAAIIEFLAQKGHRSLGFAAVGRRVPRSSSYEFDPDVQRLLDSLRRAAAPRSIEIRPEWTVLVTSQAPQPHLRNLLAGSPRPTAIVCFEQSMSAAVLDAAESLRLRCPEDFSLINRASPDVRSVPATYTSADAERLGRIAMRLLAERMHGLRDYTVKLAVPPRLVLGTTTGFAPHP